MSSIFKIQIMNSEYVFCLQVDDGYSFRNTVNYLKATNIEGHFSFSREGITYEQTDASGVLFNEIVLRKSDVQIYIYDSDDEMKVGVSLVDLHDITRKITKKDGLIIYRKKSALESDDERYLIWFKIVPVNRTARSNTLYLKEKMFDDCNYEQIKYARSINDPNFNFNLSEFSKMCKNLSAIKCDTICIQGFKDEILLKAETEGKGSGHVERIGLSSNNTNKDLKDIIAYIPEVKLEDQPPSGEVVKLKIGRTVITEIHVPRSIIKGLTQMNNICAGGTIKFYLEPNMPIRLICPIGHYGTLTVHLRGLPNKH